MQRRFFLKQLAWLSGGLLAGCYAPVRGGAVKGTKVSGRVHANGKGLEGVVVSDGYSVVTTNGNGVYQMELHNDAQSIFVSTPSGFAFNTENGIARHYHSVNENSGRELHFNLQPLAVNDDKHQFIIWADPQVKNEKDVQKMMAQPVPDVRKLVSAAGPDSLVHGITVGDIVWDELDLFSAYNKAVEKMGIPFFQCLGNHDMDYRKGGDETSDDTFQKTYGPTYYSFNRGQVHYVIMDNVRYLGTERDYDGYFQQHQLDWLRKDLALVPAGKLIVLCVHIPVFRGTKNRDDFYSVLGDRNVHIMSGHTHYHVNSIQGKIYEHNHGTVCGAWWTGPICSDGTPCGYGVYQVNGTELSWHYQSTGKPADHQMKLYVKDFDVTNRQLLANIWNYDAAWKNEYWVDGISKGALEQFEGYDPLSYETMLGTELPKPRGFAEPHKTGHLFRALIPVGAREVKVTAADRFGKMYTETYKLS
jgi:3',5'-cyclic AMP phosphodiesterase CpdA